ncbi:MAG: DNA polymerase III subunit alpha [Planctomycetes bacterium]|nr:DNA polymerase III subunit alpha [Planctomycetota bacterium]
MYVPLRTHGWHSLLTGVDPPAALLERAAEFGLAALALTDVDTLGGSVDFLRAAEKFPVRAILGAEISDPSARPGRVIALARDEQGYRNLCKLVSARQLGDDPGAAGAELVPENFELVAAAERFQEGLTLLVDHPRLALALVERVPARQLFVAVSPAALARRSRARRGARAVDPEERVPLLAAPKVPPPARAVAAQELVACARALGLATLAVPDVYCARAAGHEAHRVRIAIKHNALRNDLPEEWLAERPTHLLAAAEMEALYAALPECRGPFRTKSDALRRTLAVAEACRYVPPLGRVIFPSVELAGRDTPYSRLCELAFDGARKRYVPLRPEVVRRLEHELAAIENLGFAPYFLLVKKIADFARAKGIPCVGRGSAADSLVAYCLALTDADPLRYRLPFERFLNPARKDRPDIDLDFCWRRRDEVLAEVGAAFGVERTAMIATLSTFGLRAAFREVALAEGLAPVEVNRWSRRLPGMGAGLGASEAGEGEVPDGDADEEEDDGEALEAARGGETRRGAEENVLLHALPRALEHDPIARTFAATPECRGFPFEDPRYAFVLRMASALLDCPRHLGLHPGGVVVTPGPISDFVACQRASKGVLMTQLDKHGVEAIGLVKMDLLGNRALTVIDDCLRALGLGAAELEAIPEDDAYTAELLVHGRTLGCFQVESPGMRNLLQQIAARTMDAVIQAVALIRPGPAGSGMKDAFIRRFRGLEPPHAPHARLNELLHETQGVMLYQEDVMQAVVLLAGFDLAEADQLRRSLAKKRGAELEALRERFLTACARETIAAADAARIWELVANFSAFGFCKAHAVTYGRIAYRTVWLKAHHPAAFLCAFLNSQTGYYEARVYVEEARRAGVAILPPDVNKSSVDFTLERGGDGRDGLRVGLGRVKGLSEATRLALLAERARGGAYLSLPDFLERTRARADECERLILCGAFDAFDRTRPEMLLRLHLLSAPARKPPPGLDAALLAACRTTPAARERESGWSHSSVALDARRLAPGESTPLFPAPPGAALALPALPELDLVRRGRLELELLGLSVCAHPTVLFPCASARDARPPLACAELARHRDQRVELVGWLAASRPVRTSAGGWMRFLTLEDESGIAEVVVFPPLYARDGHRLVGRGPFRIRGRVEEHLGACTLHAERIE